MKAIFLMAELNNTVIKVFSNGPRRPRDLDLKITSYKSNHPDPSTGSAVKDNRPCRQLIALCPL